MDYKWEPGQKVILHTRYHKCVETIKRVTPTGLAVIRKDQYKRDGQLRGLGRWDINHITPATEEEIKKVNEQNTIVRVVGELGLMNWSKAITTYEDALKAKAFLKEIKLEI